MHVRLYYLEMQFRCMETSDEICTIRAAVVSPLCLSWLRGHGCQSSPYMRRPKKNQITMTSLSNEPGSSQLQTVTPRFVTVRHE